jgi:hypothetical protein
MEAAAAPNIKSHRIKAARSSSAFYNKGYMSEL